MTLAKILDFINEMYITQCASLSFSAIGQSYGDMKKAIVFVFL